MWHIPLPLWNGLITRSGLEPNFLRIGLCCEVKLGLATCGGGMGEKVLGLFEEQYQVGRVWFRGHPSGGLAVCRAFSG